MALERASHGRRGSPEEQGHELGPAPTSQLLKDVREVVLNGFLAQGELLGYLPVVVAFGGELGDLYLPLGEAGREGVPWTLNTGRER